IFKAPFRIMKALMGFLGQALQSFVKRFNKIGSASDGAITKQSDMATEISESANNKPNNVIGYDPVDGHLKQIDTDSIELKIRDIERKSDNVLDDIQTGKICPISGGAIATQVISETSFINLNSEGCPNDVLFRIFGYTEEYVQEAFDKMSREDQLLYKDMFDALMDSDTIDISDITKLKAALHKLSLFSYMDQNPKLTKNQILAYEDEFTLPFDQAAEVNEKDVFTWLEKDENGRIIEDTWMANEVRPFFAESKYGNDGMKPRFRNGLDPDKAIAFQKYVDKKRIKIAQNYNSRLLADFKSKVAASTDNNEALIKKYTFVVDYLNTRLDTMNTIDVAALQKVDYWPKGLEFPGAPAAFQRKGSPFAELAEMEQFLHAIELNERIIAAMIADTGVPADRALKIASDLNKNTVHKLNHVNGYDSVTAFRTPIKDPQRGWVLEGELYLSTAEAKFKVGTHGNPFFDESAFFGSYLSKAQKSKTDHLTIGVIAENLGIKDKEEMAAIIKQWDDSNHLKGVDTLNFEAKETSRGFVYGSSIGDTAAGGRSGVHKITWDLTPLSPDYNPKLSVLSTQMMDEIRIKNGPLPKKLLDLKIPYYDESGQAISDGSSYRIVTTFEELRSSIINGEAIAGGPSSGRNLLTPQDSFYWDTLSNKMVYDTKYDYRKPSYDFVDTSHYDQPGVEFKMKSGTSYDTLIVRSEKIQTEFIPTDPNLPDNSVGIFSVQITELQDDTFAWKLDSMSLNEAAEQEQQYLLSQMNKLDNANLQDDFAIPAYILNDNGDIISPEYFIKSQITAISETSSRGGQKTARVYQFPYLLKSPSTADPNVFEYSIAYQKIEFKDMANLEKAYHSMLNMVYDRKIGNSEQFFTAKIDTALPHWNSHLIDITGTSHNPYTMRFSVYGDGAKVSSGKKYIGSYVDGQGVVRNYDEALANPTRGAASVVIYNHYYDSAIDMGFSHEASAKLASIFSNSDSGFKAWRYKYSIHRSPDGFKRPGFIDDTKPPTLKEVEMYINDQQFNRGKLLRGRFEEQLTVWAQPFSTLITPTNLKLGNYKIKDQVSNWVIKFIKNISPGTPPILNSHVGLDSVTSSTIKATRNIELGDLGDFYDEYKRPFLNLYDSLDSSDSYLTTVEHMLREIYYHDIEYQMDAISDGIISHSTDSDYVDYDVEFDELSSDKTYNFPISYTYNGQLVSFNLQLASNFTSIWTLKDGVYSASPLIVEGQWNPDIFVDPTETDGLQSQVNNGKLPRPDFTDIKDPMNFLKLVYVYDSILWQSTVTQFADLSFGTFETEASHLDSQLLPVVMFKYEEIIRDQLRNDPSLKLYNKPSGKNESLVDFFDEIFEANLLDNFMSANPLNNLQATQILTSNILKDKTISKFENDQYQRMLVSDILFSRGVLDTTIGTSLFHESGYNIGYDKLFVDLDIDSNDLVVIDSVLDYIRISPMNFLDRYKLTNTINSFDTNAHQNRILHNIFGRNSIDFAYPAVAARNALEFASVYQDYYDDFGLSSPNKGVFGALGNSIEFKFSFDFIDFGVRNDYGELPMITKFILQMLSNQHYYFTSDGELLISKSMEYMGIIA
ncbi:MAG: hypothetical protein GPJ54_01670, partial [Candidatus Heimdallarchaeota archaeon]|nr:hypothetical protein [Candidatus Heimdallarchaeota archaeon]